MIDAMGTLTLVRTDGVDGNGKPMGEVLTLRFTRAQCMLLRNQLRNQADDWRRRGRVEPMARKCDDLADAVDAVLGRD